MQCFTSMVLDGSTALRWSAASLALGVLVGCGTADGKSVAALPPPSGGAGGVGAAGGQGGAGGAPAVGAVGAATGADGAQSVVFDFPEGTAGGMGTCKAGTYRGTFTGTYVSGAVGGLLPVQVSGDLTLTLAESTSGESLVISNGSLSGMANGTYPFSGDLVGKLECTTMSLVASVENAHYEVPGTLGAPPTSYSFSGPWLASYDGVSFQLINGTWNVKEPGGLLNNLGGNGTWSAGYVGP